MGALAVREVEHIDTKRLETLAAEIRHHEAQANRFAENAIGSKIAIGQRLIEAKAMLPHGDFLPWAKTEFPQWNPRHLQKHMQIAANAPRVAHLPSMRAGLALLAPSDSGGVKAVKQVEIGSPETLVYAFNACTVFVKCACGKEAGGVMELTEAGNAEFSCAKCGRRYSVEARVKGGRK